MVVGGTRGGAIHVGALNVPGGALIYDSIVIAFVSSTSSWTATKGITHILLLDSIQRIILLRLGQRQVGSRGDSCLATFSTRSTSLIGSRHSSVQRSEVAHHLLVLLLLVGMDGLSMLAQVVKTRELFPAMTGKGTFTSMFPDVPGEMFTPTEDHATLAIASALESLCRGRAVTFVNAGRARQKGSGIVVGDQGHVVDRGGRGRRRLCVGGRLQSCRTRG